MEKNRFYEHRQEIGRISREKGVDIGVAVSILAKEQGLKDWGEEAMAFYTHVNKIPAEERAAFFAG